MKPFNQEEMYKKMYPNGCWHEEEEDFHISNDTRKCKNCGKWIPINNARECLISNPDLLNPSDKEFSMMMDWCLEKGFKINFGQRKFICCILTTTNDNNYFNSALTKYLALRDAIWAYLEEE